MRLVDLKKYEFNYRQSIKLIRPTRVFDLSRLQCNEQNLQYFDTGAIKRPKPSVHILVEKLKSVDLPKD